MNVFHLDDGSRSNLKLIRNMNPGEIGWYHAPTRDVRITVLKVTNHTAVGFDNNNGARLMTTDEVDNLYVEILQPGAKFTIEVR